MAFHDLEAEGAEEVERHTGLAWAAVNAVIFYHRYQAVLEVGEADRLAEREDVGGREDVVRKAVVALVEAEAVAVAVHASQLAALT